MQKAKAIDGAWRATVIEGTLEVSEAESSDCLPGFSKQALSGLLKSE